MDETPGSSQAANGIEWFVRHSWANALTAADLLAIIVTPATECREDTLERPRVRAPFCDLGGEPPAPLESLGFPCAVFRIPSTPSRATTRTAREIHLSHLERSENERTDDCHRGDDVQCRCNVEMQGACPQRLL